jgi:hypothetical protein
MPPPAMEISSFWVDLVDLFVGVVVAALDLVGSLWNEKNSSFCQNPGVEDWHAEYRILTFTFTS